MAEETSEDNPIEPMSGSMTAPGKTDAQYFKELLELLNKEITPANPFDALLTSVLQQRIEKILDFNANYQRLSPKMDDWAKLTQQAEEAFRNHHLAEVLMRKSPKPPRKSMFELLNIAEESVSSLPDAVGMEEQPTQSELELLSAKIEEVIAEAALAQERIMKDQEEIEQLKMETRTMLSRLRAA
jgi:predicted type IV restriction endonuclease